MNTLRTLLIVFSLGIILGIFSGMAFQIDLFYSFARWRSKGVVERGFIMLNNTIVIALVLFGGILFSLPSR